jgi:catechol 2,3-dioxygenase
VLDLDGQPQPLVTRHDPGELDVTIGADGFSYTRKTDVEAGFKLGHTL